MSSLIEQAAQRLEQLRQAGVTVPEVAGDIASTAPPAALASSIQQAAPAAGPVHLDPTDRVSEIDNPVYISRKVDLDLNTIAAAGIVVPSAPRSRMADQFRVIKRPLISNAIGKGSSKLEHSNLIMVTSALAGEGKSFTSINLAMSIAAELDHTVMLVDADVARPSVLRVLGLPPSPGLLDVLEGKADMADVLLRTNVDKFTILPSGTPHLKATELLASEAMTRLVNNIATRYSDRIVIVDSPPLLLTTESRVLATQMGQIVMVVNAGRTLQAEVQQALATIESCPVKMMVLNRARTDTSAYGYGYGYGSGYGYGYGHDESYGSGSGYADTLAADSRLEKT